MLSFLGDNEELKQLITPRRHLAPTYQPIASPSIKTRRLDLAPYFSSKLKDETVFFNASFETIIKLPAITDPEGKQVKVSMYK